MTDAELDAIAMRAPINAQSRMEPRLYEAHPEYVEIPGEDNPQFQRVQITVAERDALVAAARFPKEVRYWAGSSACGTRWKTCGTPARSAGCCMDLWQAWRSGCLREAV